MKLKELREVDLLLRYLWDFFSTNADGDESGLIEDVSEKYRTVNSYIRDEFYKIHLRNAIKRNRRKLK